MVSPMKQNLPNLDLRLLQNLRQTPASDDYEFLQAIRSDLSEFQKEVAGFLKGPALGMTEASVLMDAVQEVRHALGDLSRVLHAPRARAARQLALRGQLAALFEINALLSL